MQCFVAENLLSSSVIALSVSVVVSMEMNRGHYFWRGLLPDLHICEHLSTSAEMRVFQALCVTTDSECLASFTVTWRTNHWVFRSSSGQQMNGYSNLMLSIKSIALQEKLSPPPAMKKLLATPKF